MLACSDKAGEMGHVDEEQRADFIGDRSETSEIDVARLSRTASDDKPRPMLLG